MPKVTEEHNKRISKLTFASVYPNPTQGNASIYIDSQFEESQILIFDIQSKLVF